MLVFYFLFFIIGLSVGSFLNVLIYRETIGETVPAKARKSLKKKNWLPAWVKGRSYCDDCKRQLRWYDNIPLLSFLLLKGKCRYCQKKISRQYPLVEFLTGVEFVWIFFLIEKNIAFFSQFEGFYSFLSLGISLIVSAFLLAIFVADVRFQIIPDAAVFGAIFFTLLKVVIDYRYTGMIDFSIFSSALSASLFFIFLILITKGKGMGFGDVKLAFLLGLLLGFPKIVVALFLAFLTGALYGAILILLKKGNLKSKLAFGPFLIFSALFAFIFGDTIWQWYW